LFFHCACLLGAYFFASPPFSGARSLICQPSPCFQCVVIVCCLFFNFAPNIDFGCCSLAQEMSFEDCYLPYFRQWIITTYCWPSCLSSICLLIVHIGISSLLLPPSPVCCQNFHPLCCVLVFSSLFIVQNFFARVSICLGGYAGLSQGWLEEYLMMLVAHLFGLLNISQVDLELVSGSSGRPPIFSV
jgi:hypothetical protein